MDSASQILYLYICDKTNNAELYAALQPTDQRIAECTDSAYVILGAQGAAQGWKSRGWRGSSGRVACIELWEALLQESSKPGRELVWVIVPSHVDVSGNEEAHRLSNVGRDPHCPTKATPALQIIYTSCTPKAKRTRFNLHEASFHTPIVPRALDFSYFATLSRDPITSPHGGTHALWQELGLRIMPDSPPSREGSCCSCSTDCLRTPMSLLTDRISSRQPDLSHLLPARNASFLSFSEHTQNTHPVV